MQSENEDDRGPGRGGGCGDRDRDRDDRRDKKVTIVVNGREKTAEKGEVTFDQLVALA